MNNTAKTVKEIRFCPDIGLWAIDRSPAASCAHATAFCRLHCYNNKLYDLYPAMKERDGKNETAWAELNGKTLAKTMNGKRKGSKNRFRFCTRGEAFSTMNDVFKVQEIIQNNPDILFWIPTRAWRNTQLRDAIEQHIMVLDNARVLASLDPSNDNWEKNQIIERGWSTMFFGNNDETGGRIKCQKTWDKVNGACASCDNGCFNARFGYDQVHVHLKMH